MAIVSKLWLYLSERQALRPYTFYINTFISCLTRVRLIYNCLPFANKGLGRPFNKLMIVASFLGGRGGCLMCVFAYTCVTLMNVLYT